MLLRHRLTILQVGSLPNGTGWAGVVHGTNTGCTMYNHLQLVAWPTGVGNQIATSFRYATFVYLFS